MVKFKEILQTDWFYEKEQEYLKSKETICPFCGRKLVKKHEGLTCPNFNCLLGRFKLGKGWVLISKDKKNNLKYFEERYDFNIDKFENKKRWLELKSKVFQNRKRECEICGSKSSLHIHHILSRSEYPNLTFDEENLMILCEDCHKKIHSEDKWRFS